MGSFSRTITGDGVFWVEADESYPSLAIASSAFLSSFGSGSHLSSLSSFIVDPVLSLLLRRRSESFIINLVLKLLFSRRCLDIMCHRPSPPYGYFVFEKVWRSWLPFTNPPSASTSNGG
ncbi:hypothetical protein QYF36_016131 [Acer negundo]|nr:hypothetical protein QYF36_016131 [Acer negundo]